MKSFGNTIKILILVLAGMFVVNIAVMSIFFNVNIMNLQRKIIPEDGNSIYQREDTFESVSSENEEPSSSRYEDISDMGAPETERGELIDNEVEGTVNRKEGKDLESKSSKDTTGYYMTAGEVVNLDKLSLREKLNTYALMTKINPSEISKIYDMALDGIDYNEMDKIKVILDKYLTSDDIQKLFGIIEENKKLYLAQNTSRK